MTDGDFGRLWDLAAIFWPQAAARLGQRERYAYWLALSPYAYAPCRDNIVAHSRKSGVGFPHVGEIVAGIKPTDKAAAAEEETTTSTWDFETTKRTIGYWARLHDAGPVPEFETAEEYWAWYDQAKESMRGVEGAAPYTEREEELSA